MKNRYVAAVLAAVVAVALMPAPTAGQEPAGSGDASTGPRTPWGAPDLQGVWNNNTSTPLQRPDEFADKEVLTEEELSEFTLERQDLTGGSR